MELFVVLILPSLIKSVWRGGLMEEVGLGPAGWYALDMGITEEQYLEKCCQPDSEQCLDALHYRDDKCCRASWGGFYGFVDPARHFQMIGTRLKNRSLWSLDNLVVSSSSAVILHSKDVEVEHTVYPVHSPQAFPPTFYSFVHTYAEVHPQAVWELARKHKYAHIFEVRFRERSAFRYGVHACDQFEAGAQGAMTEMRAVEWIAERWKQLGNGALGSFVNFGAQDGGPPDPLWPLLSDPARVSFALAVEMNEQWCEEHRARLPHVTLLCTQIRSDNMDVVFNRVPVPFKSAAWQKAAWSEKHDGNVFQGDMPALDVLKVDIDNADCDMLRAFLLQVPSKFVITEVCDAVPPPFQFALHEAVMGIRAEGAQQVPWGCSISYQVHLLGSMGYVLLWRGPENAVFAHQTAASRISLPGPLDEVDCYMKTPVISYWADSRRLRRWSLELPLGDALHRIREALTAQLGGGAAWTLKM